LDHVITTSACDQDGNRVYCYGEWLKFLSYSEPLAVSYSNCTTAGMTKEIGKKLKNIFNYISNYNLLELSSISLNPLILSVFIFSSFFV